MLEEVCGALQTVGPGCESVPPYADTPDKQHDFFSEFCFLICKAGDPTAWGVGGGCPHQVKPGTP